MFYCKHEIDKSWVYLSQSMVFSFGMTCLEKVNVPIGTTSGTEKEDIQRPKLNIIMQVEEKIRRED